MFGVNNPGVTVMTESPSAGAVPTTEMDTEPFGDEADIVPARKTSRQDSLSVGWGKASENEHIAGICEPFTSSCLRGIMYFDPSLCYVYIRTPYNQSIIHSLLL